jgi:hypothetical protein
MQHACGSVAFLYNNEKSPEIPGFALGGRFSSAVN